VLKVLVLGGTAEARALTHALEGRSDVSVVASLAGVTAEPAEYGGEVRSGGFGGEEGLAHHLREAGVDVLVDATHPFAERISAHAAAAAAQVGVPLVRLVRPAWAPADGDRWIDVVDLAAAAEELQRLRPQAALLAIGRQHLGAFRGLDGIRLVVRSVDPPDLFGFTDAVAEVGRGPFSVADEVELLRRHRVGAVVTRNSGGDDAKLVAARRLGLPVVVVRRPPTAGPSAATVADAVERIERAADRRGSG
jgi:precorrin-6A/cobalt-precorrin-6A reductase